MMLMSVSHILATVSLVSLALASPATPPPATKRFVQNGITTDGPATLSQQQLDTVPLICPYGIQKGRSAKNILFVHGTGGTGDATWKGGLPDSFHAVGYSSCWANLPNLTLGDAQLTSEYVVNLIGQMYERSGRTPIYAIGHSQGNLNIQWALNFFPSAARAKVANFASLAGDFQGTDEGPLVVLAQNALINGTAPSVIQQSVLLNKQSNYLQALNKHGNQALVPTTSMYGIEDQVIQIVERATTLGSGGDALTHVAIQQICPTMVVDHFLIIINRVAFYLALDAFTHGSSANVARTVAAHPDICSSPIAPGISNTGLPNVLKQEVTEVLAVGTDGFGTPGGPLSQRTRTEPALVPYAANQP